MADSVEDARAEAKQRWEAAQAEEARKAMEAALFQLDRKPQREPPRAQPTSSSAAIYTPPTWKMQAPPQAGLGGRPLGTNGPVLDDGALVMPQCGEQLFALAGMSPPSEASFDRFFRTWFDKEHFPTMSDGVQRELQHRARSRGFLDRKSTRLNSSH